MYIGKRKLFFFHVIHSLLHQLKYFHLFVKLFLSDGNFFILFQREKKKKNMGFTI